MTTSASAEAEALRTVKPAVVPINDKHKDKNKDKDKEKDKDKDKEHDRHRGLIDRLVDELDAAESVEAWVDGLLMSREDGEGLGQGQGQGQGLGQGRGERDLDLAAVDRRIGSLVGRVDIASQDTASALDKTIDDISRAVPRLTYDLEFMRDAALALRSELRRVRERTTAAVDAETAAALDELARLDLVKADMEAAREVLREAEAWNTLESDITSYVAERNWEKAAERMAEAQRSMPFFANRPEYEGRRALMISLQNQLEAALSSALVSAINAHDAHACSRYRSIFALIQRDDEFRRYYFGSRRAPLLASWKDAPLSDAPATTTQAVQQPSASVLFKLSDFLPRFYSDLQEVVNEERVYIPAIFPDPPATLSAFLQSIIDNLDPPLSIRLDQSVQAHNATALVELIRAYHATEEFATAVARIMAKLTFASLSPSSPALETTPLPGSATASGATKSSRKPSRRLSRRLSVAPPPPSAMIGEAAALWEQALFDPFLEWQVSYGSLEKKLLRAEWEKEMKQRKAAAAPGDGAAEDSRTLWEKALTAFGLAEDALGRAFAFTHGLGAVGLVEAVDDLFVTFLTASRVDLERYGDLRRDRAAGASGTPLVGETDEFDFEGLDYSNEDWSAVQLGLRLLDTAQGVLDRLSGFENDLRARLRDVGRSLREAKGDGSAAAAPPPPPSAAPPVAVGAASGTSKGALLLLQQSPLNSVHLRALIDTSEAASPTPIPTIGWTMSHHKSTHLLSGARSALTAYTRSTQLFLQDTILGPLEAYLSQYATLPTWTSTGRKDTLSQLDVQIPAFSLSPTETMSRVAEGLLNLPRLFEVYAEDDSLAFSIATLPHVNASAFAPTPATPSPDVPPPSARRASFIASPSPEGGAADARPPHRRSPSLAFSSSGATNLKPPPPPADATTTGADEGRPSPPRLSAQMVLSAWLSSLTLSLLHHLTTAVLPTITLLSEPGARQLASDLAYLSNVVAALNVDAAELERWKQVAEMTDEEGRAAVAAGRGKEEDVFDKVARIRRWTS